MKKIIIIIVVLAFVGIIAYKTGGVVQENGFMNHEKEMMKSGEQMDHDMTGMDGHMMMDMTVSSERAFLEGMIPHHQEAVDTAKEVLERGATTPEIKQLVETIIVAQEAEIAAMKEWYQDWYGVAYVADGSYKPMMRPLEDLAGAELDKTFLKDMIMHHMGAIMMAQSVQPHIEHEEIAALTKAIATTQSQEIMEMRMMLESL